MQKDTAITFGQVGGSMVSLGLTALSAILDAKGVAPSVPWNRLTPVAIAFFALFVYWGWASTSLRLRRLEDTRPTVHVSPHFNGNMAWLLIENRGNHEAKFGANITMFGIKLSPEDDNMYYDAKWKDLRDTALMPIAPDGKCVISIAQTNGCDLDTNEGIQLFTALETRQGIVPFGSTMECEVQIVSAPRLKKQFVKRYVLRIDPETHRWNEFEEVES